MKLFRDWRDFAVIWFCYPGRGGDHARMAEISRARDEALRLVQ